MSVIAVTYNTGSSDALLREVGLHGRLIHIHIYTQ